MIKRRPRISSATRPGLDDHRRRRVAHVGDVDVRDEAGLADQRGAAEDVPEQLVDLAAHPLEVGEQVLLRGHEPTG
jgi:hypothetical protein